ncbi:MAG: FAD-dependent oxidoreductase [Acidobacteria bacterium]|nr:FAD-dependent oxidoreductase [Acidobacteriota bacterium]
MMAKKVIVLGGGVTGLGTAWRLAEKGIPVDVIEAGNDIGGLAATVEDGPYRLDYGPHFILSEQPQLLKTILSLFDEELPVFERSAQLYFHGRFYNYPLTAKNVLLQMPFRDSFMCGTSYITRLIWDMLRKPFAKKKENPSFADWAKSSFGDYLFRLFFKPYTEQFWQLPVDSLSPDSIPTNTRLSFFKTLKLLFVKDIVKSKMSLVERETTLLLRYPREGIGQMSKNIAARIEANGGKVFAGRTVTAIEQKTDGTFIVRTRGPGGEQMFEGDRVVSTLPLPEMIPLLRPEPPADVVESAARLSFLSLIILYIVVPDRELLQSSYVYHLATPYNRIGDMNKFCPDLCPPDENMLALEFTCHQGEELWTKSREELLEKALGFLERDGILRREEVKKIFVLKASHAYPIYTVDYLPHLEAVRSFVKETPGLDIVGRSGNYQYMDMDQCLHLGFELADKIAPVLIEF